MPDIDMGREGSDRLAKDPTNMGKGSGRVGTDSTARGGGMTIVEQLKAAQERVAVIKAKKAEQDKLKKEKLALRKKQKRERTAEASNNLYQSIKEEVHGVVVRQQQERRAAQQNRKED